MTVEEYELVRTKAGTCSICRREPSIAIYEKRDSTGAVVDRIELCARCNTRNLRGYYAYSGPANSFYAINEVAKTDLMVYLVDIIENRSFHDSIAALGKLFRRKHHTKRLQRIIDNYRRREAVLSLFSESEESVNVAIDAPESWLEQLLFKNANKISIWLAAIIISLLGWMLFAQLLMWLTGYK